MQRHPLIRKSLAERDVAVAGVEEARARYLPAVTLGTDKATNGSGTGLLRVQQPLWTGGRLDAGFDLAQSRQTVAEMAVLESRRQLVEQAAALYNGVLGQRAMLEIAGQSVEAHDQLLAMIQRRQRGGVAAEADVRVAQARVSNARAQVSDLVGQLRRQELELANLTGGQAGVYGPVPEFGLNWADETALLTLARANSPTLQRKQLEIAVVGRELEQHRSERWPTLSVRADRYFGTESVTAGQSKSRVGLALEASLDGAGYVSERRVQGDAARQQAAREDLAAAGIELERRVQQLGSDRQIAQRQVGDYDEVVRTQEEAIESGLRLFDAGRKSWVEVLNAQKELFDAKLARERARIGAGDAQIRLAALCGVLDAAAGVQP